ncbi:hypothetical protein C8R43DRAFT_1244750 [Mycena crocata]|nr:hypothetical protein C8R43DRAFT_1244750 [Mycena crocata]
MPVQAQVPRLEESVDKLPLRLRPVARAAAAGSRKDIQHLLANLESESQSLLFFPAFFPHLHPRGIPDVAQLDGNLTRDDPAIENAVDSLTYMSLLKLPEELAATVWNRSWPWVEFIHTYRAQIPSLQRRSETALYSTLLLLFQRLRENLKVASDIQKTPGLLVIVARAWNLLLLEPEEDTRHDSNVLCLCTFIGCMVFVPIEQCPLLLEDFCEGAGGGLSQLAALVVTHLNRYSKRYDPRGSPSYLSAAIIVVTYIRDPAFQDALRMHGVIRAVTRATCALNNARFEGAVGEIYREGTIDLFPSIFDFFALQFRAPQASPYIREAIQAGVVPAIVACATHTDAGEESFIQLIYVLEPYTVYYSVLSCLELAFQSVKDLQTRPSFTRSRVLAVWSDFWDLAQERITVMKHYDSDVYVSLKACDNVECNSIHRRCELMRCSSCKGPYYCSKQCQAVDWKDGHRDFCRTMQADLLKTPEHISARDRSFLRALISHEYKLKQLDILQHEFELSSTFPNDPPCIHFDYKPDVVDISLTPLSKISAKWPDEARRMLHSDGRRQLHSVSLPNGIPTVDRLTPIHCTRLFPLQSSSSVLADALQGLTMELQDGIGGSAPISEQIRKRISGLMQTAAPHLVQFH